MRLHIPPLEIFSIGLTIALLCLAGILAGINQVRRAMRLPPEAPSDPEAYPEPIELPRRPRRSA